MLGWVCLHLAFEMGPGSFPLCGADTWDGASSAFPLSSSGCAHSSLVFPWASFRFIHLLTARRLCSWKAQALEQCLAEEAAHPPTQAPQARSRLPHKLNLLVERSRLEPPLQAWQKRRRQQCPLFVSENLPQLHTPVSS